MKKLKKILGSKSGNSYPLAIVISLVVLLLSSAAYEFIRLNVIAQGVRDSVQSAIISVAVANYDDTYAPVREGYGAGYSFDETDWNEQLDLGDVYARIDGLLGLQASGGYHVKPKGESYEYRISGLSVDVTNTPFAPEEGSQRFSADVTLRLEVPMSFGWSAMPPMTLNLKLAAGYTQKF